jgi:hypothetical protein
MLYMIFFVSFLDDGDSFCSISHVRFQNFYEQGEREKLLAEVSELRKQVYNDILISFSSIILY